jgi:hypothetical protein
VWFLWTGAARSGLGKVLPNKKNINFEQPNKKKNKNLNTQKENSSVANCSGYEGPKRTVLKISKKRK